jgi:type II secretory pathway component GspD/PulD (secretin)
MARIDSTEAENRSRNIQEQADVAKRTAAEQAQAQAQDKARKLNESIDRVRSLQIEQKYEEALQVVESQILFLDPTNPTGLLLRDVLSDTIVWRRYNDINRAAARSYGNQDLDNAEAAIAPGDIVNYPSDWPAISATRGTPVAFAEAEENRRALATLQTKRIPVKFEETPLEAAIGFIQTVSQLNIDTDWTSLEDQGIDRGTTVNLNLTNVTLETVLNRITEKVSPPGDSQGGAGWTITDGVINIASKQVINRQRTLAIYDIRDLIVEVPDYPDAPELDLQQALQASQQGGGGGGQSPFQQEGDEDPERRTLAERTQEIIDILTTNVDTDGWRENGGDTGYIQQLSGLLIITNTPANHRSIHGLLSKLREYRALQINVETRFLLVSQDFFEQIGVDLDVYLNANSNVVRQARGTRPTTRASDFFDPVSGRYRDTFPQAGATGANTNRTPLGDPWSPIGVGQNSLGLSESLIGTDFAQDVFQTAPALGIAGQFLDDIQVDFMIKATQADRRTVSLTAPRLTFTNGQISNIYVITQVSFVSDLEPVTSESAAAFDPTPATVAEGVVMEVDGTVAADRKYVTMNIIAGVTRVDAISQLPVTAIAGGQLVNSASAQSFIQLPQVTVTRVATTVTVPDQGTILLGGQRLTTEQEVESGVPVLSKIPVLNRLFTNRVMTREENTLLILLKPTILIQSEKEEENFPGLSESLSLSTR